MSIDLVIRPDAANLAVFESSRGRQVLSGLEQAGVDAIIVDHPGGALTNFDISAAILANTKTARVAMTHWAGVMDPPEAARQIASLSCLGRGRLALRVVPDGLGVGPFHGDHESEAWERTDEYLRLLVRLWLGNAPFDHEGAFYSLREGHCAEKPFDAGRPPVWISDLSAAALKTVGRHADLVELPPVAPGEAEFLVRRINTFAAEAGRPNRVRFSLPVRQSLHSPQPRYPDGPLFDNGPAALEKYLRAGVTTFVLSGEVTASELERFCRATEIAQSVTPETPSLANVLPFSPRHELQAGS